MRCIKRLPVLETLHKAPRLCLPDLPTTDHTLSISYIQSYGVHDAHFYHFLVRSNLR
jgi:hypothetical protein